MSNSVVLEPPVKLITDVSGGAPLVQEGTQLQMGPQCFLLMLFFFFYLFSACYFKMCDQPAAEVDRDYTFSPVTEFPSAKIETCG